MYWVRIADVQPANHQETNTPFLDVTFEITNGKKGEIVASQKAAFPIDASEKVLNDAAKVYLNGFVRDEQFAKDHEQDDKITKHVSSLREKLVGAQVSDEDAAKMRNK